jgi:pimeloyl-ACP methyl ester carboxylesterase
MNPVYFGSSQFPLFGVYHPPQTRGLTIDGCIVLCYPMAHEYMYVHRAFRQLATRLARTGFHVFRFDYYGFGDSAGDSEESHIEHWIIDISAAIDEIRSLSAASKISLIGLRLGATAAALTAVQRDDIENIVLWDPIINGSKYVEELHGQHESWADENLYHASDNSNSEIIGTPFTPRMRAYLEKTDLMKLEKNLAKNMLIIENSKSLLNVDLRTVLQSLGNNFEHKQIPAPHSWNSTAGMNTHYVPNQVLNIIISWISKVSK